MTILDGKRVKNEILDNLKKEVLSLSEVPHLVVIQVGNDEASNIYINNKAKMAEYIGYKFTHKKYAEDITEDSLITEITKLNHDQSVHAILVQMPLPNGLNSNNILNAIDPKKDVDGLTDENSGALFHKIDALYPCTPSGVMALLKYYNIDITGKHAVVVGRSNLVGKPMAIMLLNAGATVTVCHSKTINLSEHTKNADILVVATGNPHLITADMVKPGSVIIDVGINRTPNGITGDVDFENASLVVSAITPVPGGVGQMTVALLATNILKAYKLNKEGVAHDN